MVKTKLCNLHGMSPKELVEHHEEAEVRYVKVVKLRRYSMHASFTTQLLTTALTFTGNGRLFYRERHRKGHPYADYAEEELSDRHVETEVEEQGAGVHAVW